jgi:hypothetical protein
MCLGLIQIYCAMFSGYLAENSTSESEIDLLYVALSGKRRMGVSVGLFLRF